MEDKGILNELRKTMDKIKQKPLSKPEVYMMSLNVKYQLDNKLLCLQEENTKLEKENEALKLSRESIKNNYVQLVDKLVKENAKLKKVIEFLNKVFNFELGVSVVNEKYHYSLEYLLSNPYIPISKKLYDLLKGVFEK